MPLDGVNRDTVTQGISLHTLNTSQAADTAQNTPSATSGTPTAKSELLQASKSLPASPISMIWNFFTSSSSKPAPAGATPKAAAIIQSSTSQALAQATKDSTTATKPVHFQIQQTAHAEMRLGPAPKRTTLSGDSTPASSTQKAATADTTPKKPLTRQQQVHKDYILNQNKIANDRYKNIPKA